MERIIYFEVSAGMESIRIKSEETDEIIFPSFIPEESVCENELMERNKNVRKEMCRV